MMVNVFGRVLHIHTTTKSYTPKKMLYKSLTLFIQIVMYHKYFSSHV